MVIVLKDADFSQNNLGQIEVTTILDDFTKAAITASGNYAMSDIQKSSLNSFFKKIGAFGDASAIFGKLYYLFLPIISNDVAFSAVDYVTNGKTTVDNTKFELRNHGLAVISDSTPASITISGSNTYNENKVSIFAMQTEVGKEAQVVDVGTSLNRFCCRSRLIVSPDGLSAQLTRAGSALRNAFVAQPSTSVEVLNMYGYVVNGTSLTLLDCSGNKSDYTITETTASITGGATILSSAGTGATSANAPVGIIAIADVLTSDEITVLYNACNALRDAFVS